MTALLNLPWLAANLPGYLQFRRALTAPERIQRVLLSGYLRGNADTAFGRAHGFAAIRSAEEYRERVPLTLWEDMAPWIDRIAAGEPGILTRSSVRTLEPTSGSSAAAKLIPYTAELQREIRRAVAPWVVDLYGHRPRLALGSAYWSITPLALDDERPAGPVRVGFE
ncbi:MAG TPA: GH3 auxin-responsive promoter family protein, partial [Thermoanaerobaculia bacterium]